MDTELEYLKKQTDLLKGARVLDAGVLEDEDLLIPAILFKLADGRVAQLEILGDPEGNFSAHIEMSMLGK